MKATILVTDTLFIYPEHIKKLNDAGYDVERIEKPDSTESELCEAVKGKVGYILGGIESVTEKIIDAADQLKVISVLAVGYEFFVPAWKHALDKGIVITSTPSGPTNEVAEWAVTACLIMNRNFLELGKIGDKQFAVTKGIESQKVGIIGLGRIGSRVAEIVKAFKPHSIRYSGRQPHPEKEKPLGVSYLELPELLNQSDIVFLTVGDDAKNFIGAEELKCMKDGSLLVNITHPGIIVETALLTELRKGRIRAITDHPMSREFDSLPYSHWYSMNSSNTITEAGSKLMSDMATESILNVLAGGEDQYDIRQQVL